jgi:hypothetical protein
MHPARVRRLTATLAGCAIMAWLLSGGLHGAIFRVHVNQPVSAATTTSAIVTSQCQALPAPSSSATGAAGSSASPTAAATPPDLCVSVQAAQSSIKPGQTATWTVRVWSQNGAAPGTKVTLSTTPSGLPVSFTSACPTGDGDSTCITGDLGTSVTPTEYQMQAQVLVPGWETSLGNVTLSATANADTNPAMAVVPVAGQVIIVIDPPKPSPTPSRAHPSSSAPTTARTTPPASRSTSPAPAPAATPAASIPAVGPVPPITLAPSTLVPNTSTDLPLPDIAPNPTSTNTALAPATVGLATSSAANIQALGVSTSPATADNFTLTLGMSAATAQALALVVLGLAFILAITKIVADAMSRSRHPAAKKEPRPRPANRKPVKFPRLKRPHWPRRRPSGVPHTAPLTPKAQGNDADAPA